MKLYGHHGFRRFVLCLGYKSALIKDFFLRYREQTADFTLDLKGDHEPRLPGRRRGRGLAGDLRRDRADDRRPAARLQRVRDYVDADTFMFTYGDGLGPVDITSCWRFTASRDGSARSPVFTRLRATARCWLTEAG